jgi:hypothetical protein
MHGLWPPASCSLVTTQGGYASGKVCRVRSRGPLFHPAASLLHLAPPTPNPRHPCTRTKVWMLHSWNITKDCVAHLPAQLNPVQLESRLK